MSTPQRPQLSQALQFWPWPPGDPAPEIWRVILELDQKIQLQVVDAVVEGFSLIFQFYVHRFEALARYLRANGVDCHFTIGGHFPSLSSEETLALVPQIDS